MRTPKQKAARLLPSNTGNGSEHHHDTRLLVGPREAAVMLDLSERKLWQLTKDGAIPSAKIDRRTVYPVAGLRAWVAAGCPTEPGSGNLVQWGVSQ